MEVVMMTKMKMMRMMKMKRGKLNRFLHLLNYNAGEKITPQQIRLQAEN